MTSLPPPLSIDKPVKSMTPNENHAPCDYILRIKEEPLRLIEEGKKNYEYRKYALGEGIERVWLYEDGSKVIRLVLVIGGMKTPGQVKDARGEGNNEFNEGKKGGKFGYPILRVLRLPRSITKEELREDFEIDMEKGRQFVTRALAGVWPVVGFTNLITHEHL